MRGNWIMIGTIIGIILIGAVTVGPIMSNVETPNYDVVKTEGNIEIRQYAPMIIAEVQINGNREDSIGTGFSLLAGYIFGNNIAKHDIAMTAPVQQQKGDKISMTAPVQQQKGDKISMTAPVQQQKSEQIAMTAPVQQNQKGNTWEVSFVMPSKYTMDTLPKPGNDLVKLKQIPAKKFVAINFSGTNTDANVEEHEEKLMKYIKSKNISVIGSPKYAFYNPPWTLPFMRRNEVMIEIQKQ